MRPLPSRLKIALLSAGISGIVLIAFAIVMSMLIHDMRIETVDREIRTLASRHPGLFAGRGSYERLGGSLEFAYGADYTNHVILFLRNPADEIVYTTPHWPADIDPKTVDPLSRQKPVTSPSPAAGTNTDTSQVRSERGNGARGGFGRGFGQGRGGPPEVLLTKEPRFFTKRGTTSVWRFGVLGNDDVTIVIGLNQQEVHHDLDQVRNAFLLALPVALFLVGLGGWIVAGRALHPLKTIADTAERVTASGLHERIPLGAEGPEATRLINVLNQMMNRLETSFRQATRFSADASHELKTPLAIMQGELENALQSAEPGSSEQQLFSNLLEEAQRLKTITRSLLLLSQADTGQLKLSLETVDLSAELEPMLEDARVLASESGLQFEVQITPHQLVQADRPLLHTAVFNLISNAIKYNEPKGTISLRLEPQGDTLLLTIGNSGIPIPTADQPKIFDRFFRGGRPGGANVDGVGLGLSLAREIVRAHGGELALRESHPGWTSFTLSLPVHKRQAT